MVNLFLCRPYYCYFPFSLGPRSCIGQVFAQVSRGLEEPLVSKHWASSGCAGHGWWWAPEGLHWCPVHWPSPQREDIPPGPWQACLSNAVTRADIHAAKGSAGRSSRLPSPQTVLGHPAWIQTPLMGITVSIPLPAKVKHTGDVQGVLGIILWLPVTESRQGKHQLEEDTSQNWHREGEKGATCTEGTISCVWTWQRAFQDSQRPVLWVCAHLSTRAQSTLVLQSDFQNGFNT